MAYQKRSYPARKRLDQMTPAEQLAEQIKRVEKLGLRVVGHGTFKADGIKFYLVPSISEKLKNMHHVVRQTSKGLECDCYACTESHLVCVHRAAVYLHLKAAAEAAAKAQPAKAAPVYNDERETWPHAPKLPAPTQHEQASRRVEVGATARRAAAAMPADNTPETFSPYR